MPIVEHSEYKRPFYLFNKHLETILPSMFRKIDGVYYERERLETNDKDFLDLDWLNTDSRELIIICHGLEGSSKRHYVKGMAKFFNNEGWNVLAWNCRSCSGEINRTARLYHHAASDDLKRVIEHVNVTDKYDTIVLAGFSMGGNLIIKYLGENTDLPANIKVATVFSVPFHLESSAVSLEKIGNRIYKKRFLAKLRNKIKAKSPQFPAIISFAAFEKVSTFRDFDNLYTAPIHGFKDADDFYSKARLDQYLPNISLPLLIVNALNDPILPEECYPKEFAEKSKNVFLEMPEHGGHVGFSLHKNEFSWAEKRAFGFIKSLKMQD